jgi:hypothetical protein
MSSPLPVSGCSPPAEMGRGRKFRPTFPAAGSVRPLPGTRAQQFIALKRPFAACGKLRTERDNVESSCTERTNVFY